MEKRKLLLINYAMDSKHQVFSHQVDLVNKLAKRFDHVTVLTGSLGVFQVAENVNVICYRWVEGKRFSSLIRFLFTFVRSIKSQKYSVLFSHMTSVQSAFIAPITKLIGLRHFLWYAHTSNNIYLKIARALTDGIITSTSGSCPLDGRKIDPIGQSIDKSVFSKKAKVSWPITKIVHIGRFDPSKDIEVIINTVEKVRHSNPALTLEIIGSSSSDKFEEYEREVKNRFLNKPEYSWVKFTSHISRAELPEVLKSKEAFIHAFQGSLDKTLVEATFTGLPVVTINNEYLKIFGFWEPKNQPGSYFLEKELTKLLTLSESELQAEVERRYEIAVRNHEISGWVDRLVSVLSGQAK